MHRGKTKKIRVEGYASQKDLLNDPTFTIYKSGIDSYPATLVVEVPDYRINLIKLWPYSNKYHTHLAMKEEAHRMDAKDFHNILCYLKNEIEKKRCNFNIYPGQPVWEFIDITAEEIKSLIEKFDKRVTVTIEESEYGRNK